MNLKLLLSVVFIISLLSVHSQTKTFFTTKLNKAQLKIDGFINEADWETVSWEDNFTQLEPNEGKEPTQNTEFKILYDNDFLYVAIKSYDTDVSKIEKRLSGRDSWDGDLIGVQIDSYFDKKTVFVFAVSASGGRSDGISVNDNIDNFDDTWNPLWETETKVTDFGWSAEMKIPLSQLRFNAKKEQIWGLQVVRYLYRNKEWDMWQFIPKESSGWASRFGELRGLIDLNPKKLIEISPYISSKSEHYEKEDGNPYANGNDLSVNAGIDGKIGLTNNLTLDFAVNPDFGQVEADPSEVNLTAFETYFSEKRPFFIEGNNITDYQITPGGSAWSDDNLLYSRRLGGPTHYYPESNDGEYIKLPVNSRILGALKLTGKTKSGLSVGIMETFTNKEFAKINANSIERKEPVEPYTNFFAARLQKDLNEGNTVFGGMITSMYRFIDHTNFDFLNTSAITGGLDFKQYFKDKKYYFEGKLIGSRIDGSTEAISEQQLSSRRYYQMPDADYLSYDSTRTSLSGYGGNLSFRKKVSKGLRYAANVTWRSPGIELNDMGYLRKANSIFQYIWAGYSITEPFSVFREAGLNVNEWSGWDYSGKSTFLGASIGAWARFKNFWSLSFNLNNEGKNIDNSVLRGGPSLILPGTFNYSIGFGTNSTKKLQFYAQYFDNYGHVNSDRSFGIYTSIHYQPLNRLSVSLSPNYNYNNSELQYVGTEHYEYQDRYLFGEIEQKTFSMSVRIDFNLSPDFTIQYYGAPFISAGLYSDYKKITDPKHNNYYSRFEVFNDTEITYLQEEGIYGINENADSNFEYFFSKPDYNFQQFRSNLVLRWEYKAGSMFYIVWSQDRTDVVSDGTFNFGSSLKNILKISAYDVFLLKISYRFMP